MIDITRKEFLSGVSAACLAAYLRPTAAFGADTEGGDAISIWQRETEKVSSEVYGQYLQDGNTRGLAALEKLEAAFDKLLRDGMGRGEASRPNGDERKQIAVRRSVAPPVFVVARQR